MKKAMEPPKQPQSLRDNDLALLEKCQASLPLLRLAHLLDRAAGAVKLPAAAPPLPGEDL